MTTRPASPSSDTILLALLGGAVVGALVMALVTPKTGREVRATLRTAGRRLSGGRDELDELEDLIEASFI
jgi:gas vesicle protein